MPRFLCFAFVVCALSACTGVQRVDLDTPQHETVLTADRLPRESQIISLTIDQAVARALDKNLDARVAALEALAQQKSVSLAELRVMPQMEFSAGKDTRSNIAASSSRAVATGLQSLEASQSSDRSRETAELQANWNLLDAALALSDARKASHEAGVAQQRLDKVIQNVERDVVVAYWRALAFQDLKINAEKLIQDTQGQMDKIEQARAKKLLNSEQVDEKLSELTQRVQAFQDLKRDAELGQLELKSLLSYAPETQIKLISPRPSLDGRAQNLLQANVEKLEEVALKNRPEMREEILKRNMTAEDARREIIQTFPGFSTVLSRQYDSNNFLVHGVWNNVTLSVAQSITNLLTLPVRLDAAQSRAQVADARRQALNAAVIAQIHIARTGLSQSRDAYKNFNRLAQSAQAKSRGILERRKRGLVAGEGALAAQLDAQTSLLRANLAYADYQESYAALRNSFGCSVTTLPVASSQKGCGL
jgi:outer membrane protein, multidrug efflux system